MISFPNAKINLGLRITGKRKDGYHYLQSLMIPLKFCDILEFRISGKDKIYFSGLPIPGNPESNLVGKALRLVRQKYQIPPLEIHLHKIIPMGAGLGGGSSDAAFMIRMLNSRFQLEMEEDEMLSFAGRLGSDCSFFIRNKAIMISGTGDILEDFNMKIPDYKIVLIHPGFPVSTTEAYSGVSINPSGKDLFEILKEDKSTWKDKLQNDFESSIFKSHPELGDIKSALYNNGAFYASMSGSGSVIFGLFEKTPEKFTNLPGRIFYQGNI